jgi:hypothetical protein
MIWHIFRKDARLLWPMALAVALLQSLCAARTVLLGHFSEPRTLAMLSGFLPLLLYLGIVLVTITAVHQDCLPGVRQDWLTRPIRRRDLLLSKLLFVVLMLHLPILLVDVAEQLALGFPLLASLGVSASRAASLLCIFTLPALMLGAVTRSLTDALVFGIAATIGFTVLIALSIATPSPGTRVPPQPGMEWIPFGAAGLVILLGAPAALAFQYVRRRTVLARGIGLAVVALAWGIAIGMTPISTLAIQRWVWGSSAEGAVVSIAFVPDRQQMAPQTDNGAGQATRLTANLAAEKELERNVGTEVALPLRIDGLEPGQDLWADQVRIRVTSASGAVPFEGYRACSRAPNGIGVSCIVYTFEARARDAAAGDTLSVQRFKLPIAVYEQVKHQSVRLDISYVLTRFAQQPSQAIRTTGELRRLPEMGSCATRLDADDDESELRCLTQSGVPSCVTALIEDPQSNRRNPEWHMCQPNYAPFRLVWVEDVIGHSAISMPYRDPSGLARYPVDGTTIQRALMRLTTYDAVDHFQRTLVIPSITLADWEVSKTADGSAGSTH